MSEELLFSESAEDRPLRSAERALIATMLAGKYDSQRLALRLAQGRVREMQDGGMGSIRFLETKHSARTCQQPIAEAEYVDEDGVLVSIVINLNDDGDLCEIDFWKVDFSPLVRYPSPSEVRLKS
jgi:uncharacterized protein DUF6984